MIYTGFLKFRRVGVALFFGLAPALVNACFFHPGGFGFGLDAGSQAQAGTMAHPLANLQPEVNARLRLTLPAMLRGTVGTEKALTVSFSVAEEVKNPSIQFSIDLMPGITVAQNTIRLDGQSGEHTFMLQPQQTGIFRLVLTAMDLNNEDIPELREVVFVKIFNDTP